VSFFDFPDNVGTEETDTSDYAEYYAELLEEERLLEESQ
jgi:hypothetical protein